MSSQKEYAVGVIVGTVIVGTPSLIIDLDALPDADQKGGHQQHGTPG
jgi:hypothetical protein